MSLLWTGAFRIYVNAYTEAPLFWSVDDGDSATEIKCPRVVMAGSFETVVVPEQKVQPRAWLSFKEASVYKQKDEIIVVIDWATASLRNRELYGALQGKPR